MNRSLHVLVLAAGEGTRFKSDRIKVLHPILGKPMLQIVLDSVQKLRPELIHIVVGHQKEQVKKEIVTPKINFIHQREQLGTAHAVMAAKNALAKEMEKDVLVLYGDMPLLTSNTLKSLVSQHCRQKNVMTMMSAELENPFGFGRLIWEEDEVIKIVEEKEATPAQKKLREINAGIYVFKVKDLLHALPKISNKNRKEEYYITDIVEIFTQQGKRVGVYKTPKVKEIVGVNSRLELAQAAENLRKRKIKKLTEEGVTIYDPQTTWVDLDIKIGEDTVIYSSVIIEGNSKIGKECILYPFVHLLDSRVGDRTKILSSCMIEESTIEDNAQVGPFAHLRPNSTVCSGAKIGNFVEMKNTVFGPRSKAGHLTYLGDCEVEENVNIGAGTIICNYDGQKKHKTHIEAGAFIGSGVELVAPLRIGKGAYVGAGSTITRDVAPESLAFERCEQIEKPGWAKKKKEKRKK